MPQPRKASGPPGPAALPWGAPYLHGEDDHREADGRGDAYGHDDRLSIVEAGDHAHHVGQADGQYRLRGDGALSTWSRCRTPTPTPVPLCRSKA